jgi:predicted DNA-binding WGR domain protein
MPAVDSIKVVLRACDPSLNRFRSWSVEAGLDLFGNWTARVAFGRIGSRGRVISREFASEEDVRAFVRKGIRRRGSAIRRAGVAYRVVEASPDVFPVITGVGLEWAAGAKEREEPRSGAGEAPSDSLR